ncbi:C2H2 type zinc-finger (2 copies) [Fasciola gigantica]|uniref:C2H2 type zinc-finger (2 copies) n=1 Tax=Fasciola gigantica TaxID=46835 RepID=A0A504Y8Q3_FASGI|nr:C2H2 type zinc-finger (2 copies) [Fasciola gigantica]
MSLTKSPDAGSVDVIETFPGDFNANENLRHLIDLQDEVDEKLEAAVHPEANLDMLTGAQRGPAIDLNLLKKNPHVCITCGVDFKCRANLHAHLTRHRHILGTLETFTRLPKYECRSCDGVINCASMLKHKCYSKQQHDIRIRVRTLDHDGSPLVCILCRGRLLPSRVHLIIHIIVAHSIHRDPYRCVFCHTEFHSENLMMQEVHAFDCHAPELFMITRKACFKMIRNQQGGVAEVAVPFTCFYDSTKLESAHFDELFENKLSRMASKEGNSDNDRQNNGPAGKRRVCTASFTTLDEFTTHLCCFHGAVAPNLSELAEEDPTEEVRRAQNRSTRVPGPTVRELLKNQTSGHHAANKSAEDEFTPPGLGAQRPGKQKARNTKKPLRHPKWSAVTKNGSYSPRHEPTGSRLKETCRMCLDKFSDETKLIQHVAAYHAAESRKRLKHLIDKEKMSRILDINLLCTECYIMFPDNLSLQVHMMVSHSSKDWRHCGLCSYEFYSDNGGTPNHLRLVHFTSSDAGESNEGTAGGGSSIEAWPLPAELMWRMIMTHETRHRERLFPPRQVPYLPLNLINTLLNSQAIQAVMAVNWMVRRAKEELEGIQSTDEEIAGVPGPITTEEAFAPNPQKPRTVSVDTFMADEARQQLTQIIHQTEDLEEDTALTRDRQGSTRGSVYGTSSLVKLPAWLVKKFTELGELNATRQVELDFVENL